MGDHHLRTDRLLDPDDAVFFDIADQVAFDEFELKRFGAQLLASSGCTKTIDVFLKGLDYYEHNTVPSKTRALLKYWAESGERYGGQLLMLLDKAEKSNVARTYRDYLNGKTNQIEGQPIFQQWEPVHPQQPVRSVEARQWREPHRQQEPQQSHGSVPNQGRYSPPPKPDGISPKAMHRVARDMPNLASCISLAAELGFTQIQIMGINEFRKTTTAMEILKEWVLREGQKATGKELYDALIEIDLRLIAEQHEQLLLT